MKSTMPLKCTLKKTQITQLSRQMMPRKKNDDFKGGLMGVMNEETDCFKTSKTSTKLTSPLPHLPLTPPFLPLSYFRQPPRRLPDSIFFARDSPCSCCDFYFCFYSCLSFRLRSHEEYIHKQVPVHRSFERWVCNCRRSATEECSVTDRNLLLIYSGRLVGFTIFEVTNLQSFICVALDRN